MSSMSGWQHVSARQRAARAMRAIEEGRKAFADGKPLTDCPYMVSRWGAGADWLLGWNQAKTAAALCPATANQPKE